MRLPAPVVATLARLVVVVAFLTLAASVFAQTSVPLNHSFILRDHPGFSNNPELSTIPNAQPNSILEYDVMTGLAKLGTNVLADAINNMPNSSNVRVNAFTYGTDRGNNPLDPHAIFHFSIVLTDQGKSGGLPGTLLAREIRSEAESDIYTIHNPLFDVTQRVPMAHAKISDDNTASNVPSSLTAGQTFLGLHGTIGIPSGISADDRSNVGGLAYFPAAALLIYPNAKIYFSIDAPWSGPGFDFKPSDILVLDNGSITPFLTHVQLGLDPDDDINALALDIVFSTALMYESAGWFSLGKGSPTLGTGPLYSTGDIFEFPIANPAWFLHRTAESNGLAFADGDIDGIVSIDPPKYPHVRVRDVNPEGDVEVDVVGGGDILDVRIDGEPFDSGHLGVDTLTLPSTLNPGDLVTVEVFPRRGGETTSGLPGMIIVPSSTPQVEDLESAVNGPNSIRWQWTNPIGYDAVGGIEVTLDGEDPIPLPGNTTEFEAVGLRPGTHALLVRGKLGGVLSEPKAETEFLETSLTAPATPATVDVAVTGQSVTVSWTFPGGAPAPAEVSIALNGVEVATPAAAPGSFVFPDPVPFGAHEITVQSVDMGSLYSLPVSVLAFVDRPVPGEVIQGLLPALPMGAGPFGIAHDETLERIYVVDSLGALTYRFDLDLNLIDTIPNPAPVVSGLACSGGDLYWIDLTGSSLITTDLDGVFASASFFSPPSGCVSCVGGLTHDGTNLWAVDFMNNVYFEMNTSGVLTGQTFSHPSGAAPGVVAFGYGITHRSGPDGDLLEVNAGSPTDGAITHITSYDTSGVPVATFDTPFIGTASGLVFVESGSAGVPSYYFADPALNVVAEIAALTPPAPLPGGIDCHSNLEGGYDIAPDVIGAMTIPDNDPAGLVSTITVPPSNADTVFDVDVDVAITHPFIGELVIELEGPDTTVVTLHNQGDGPAEDLVGRYDDLGVGTSNDNFGTLKPDGPGLLADFEGGSVAGIWRLEVRDVADSGTPAGTLESWLLRICAAQSPRYIRSDCDGDGQLIAILDALLILNFGFLPGTPTPPCLAACDVDADRTFNPILDAIFALNNGFVPGSPTPPAPYPMCGEGPNSVDALGCDTPPAFCNP